MATYNFRCFPFCFADIIVVLIVLAPDHCYILLLERIRILITKTRPCNIMQFLTAVEKDNFQMKNYNIFLIFAQNIYCEYTLEPPQ